MRAALFMGALAVLAGPAAAGYERNAVLQALDKVTGRVFTVEAPIDQPVGFGTLVILPRACYQVPPEEPPESAAFLEISEARPGETAELLFEGWMFASSPGLSALEHPVYDVIVLDCRTPAAASESPAEARSSE